MSELEIEWLDLTINARKSACMRIGPRFSVRCSNITTKAGHEVRWCSEIRYPGVYITAAREFRCSHNNAKQSFYRSFNAVFGKFGRCASEEVIVELLKSVHQVYFMAQKHVHSTNQYLDHWSL